ncbi:helix-turn-helix domain-containing protein [Pseudonocardia sp. GCM10023141]|uniref:helix-turn-helix domain-containing protein n=1 Tax=Pseudonocardia sp. GCM10023141 TaxID=3252653 RepID=UPI0036087E64
MADNEAHRITEPKELRALSHPTRWAIIELLGLEDTATATRCAEHTGESVASCSYHLGMLAKYGFVEQAAGGTGREKPWKLLRRHQQWGYDADAEPDPETELAAEALNEVYLDHTVSSMKGYLRRESREPAEWRAVAGSWASTCYLTAAEVGELNAAFAALVEPYQVRNDDPTLRPEGSRPVRLFNSAWMPIPPN